MLTTLPASHWRDLDKDTVEVVANYYDCNEQMVKIFPGIAKERLEARKTLMYVLTNPIFLSEEDSYIFPRKVLKRCGINHNTFNKMLNKYPFFVKKNPYYSKAKKVAIKYAPTEHYHKFMEIIGSNPYEVKQRLVLQMVSGCFEDIALEDSDNYRIRRDYYINDMDIDYKALDKLYNESDESLGNIINLIKVKYARPHETYRHHDCGRLFSEKGISFQNVPKAIRNAAFNGKYSYDIVNCHYSILCNLFPNDKAINHYSNNRKDIQKEISDRYDMDISDVKKLFLSILYGVSDSCRKDHPWLFKGKYTEDTVQSLLQEPVISDLFKSRKTLNRRMLNQYKHSDISGKNRLSKFLFTVENEILMTIARKCKPEVLLYDGLITSDELDVEEIEKEVLTNLGIAINIKQELIGQER